MHPIRSKALDFSRRIRCFKEKAGGAPKRRAAFYDLIHYDAKALGPDRKCLIHICITMAH
jgi:hypothetical protein